MDVLEEMKKVLERAAERVRFELEVVDIESDPELRRLYGESIPVLAVNGRNAFKARMSLPEFLEKFRRMTEASA